MSTSKTLPSWVYALEIDALQTPCAEILPQNGREADYRNVWRKNFGPVFLAGEDIEFVGAHGARISGKRFFVAQFSDQTVRGTVLILPGRTESSIKYAEVIYDLLAQGYDVLIYDHRGQGFSERITGQMHVGHVGHWEDYVEDLQIFLRLAEHDAKQPFYILGHSMGAAVALGFLDMLPCIPYAPPIAGIVLASPLVRFKFDRFPSAVVRAVIFLRNHLGLSELASMEGDSHLQFKHFAPELSDCLQRMALCEETLEKIPEVGLVVPSNGWVLNIMDLTTRIRKSRKPIHTPLLILESRADRIVDHSANQSIMTRARRVEKMSFEHAGHDLLMETDAVREPLMLAMLGFFEQNQ